MKAKTMGIREYAQHLKVSQQTISDAVRDESGKLFPAVVLVKGRKRLKVKKADKLWKEATFVNDSNAHTNPQQNSTGSAGVYAKARSAKETYTAKLAQLKFEEKAGKLCNVDDVEKAFHDIAKVTRDNMMVLPDKLAPVLASETDINEIREIMIKEIQQCLNSLSKMDLTFLKESKE